MLACHGQRRPDQVYAQHIFFPGHLYGVPPLRPLLQPMKRLPLALMLWMLLAALPCTSWAARPDPPEIKDIIVTTSDVDLLLFATVKNGFTPEMLDAVKAGTPLVFTFQLELVKTSDHWLDTSLVETAITHTLSWDATQQLYRVVFSNQAGQGTTTTDVEQAKQLMAELNGVKVIALADLVPDAPYAIHFKVVMKKGTLPLGMHNILPFSSLWNFETDWRTIEFRY